MEFLEVPLFDDDIYKLFVRLTLNLFFLTGLIFVIYFPKNRNQNYVFSLFLMNSTVFFICFTLKKLELELGMALGLFAIFSILRFRTDQIKVKDMTYMFIVIGMAVFNALSNRKTSYTELLFCNTMIVILTGLFEYRFFTSRPRKPATHTIIYDKVNLLGPEYRQQLLEDISARTGLNASKVRIKEIDLSQKKCTLIITEANADADST